MKITKRQMRQVVKEAIRGTVHGDPSKEAFLDIAMNAISKADYEKAAQAIMDSYFIDDVFDEEIEALVNMLASSRTGSTAPATTIEIEAIADDWINGKRAGKWVPENIREGNKIKITKRQLRRIIKEEKQKIIKEQFGETIDTGSIWIEFARAYSSLGAAVQDQVDAVVGAYINGGGPQSENFMETVYEQNPNAIEMAMQKLRYILPGAGDEAEEILEALEAAEKMYMDDDEEMSVGQTSRR